MTAKEKQLKISSRAFKQFKKDVLKMEEFFVQNNSVLSNFSVFCLMMDIDKEDAKKAEKSDKIVLKRKEDNFKNDNRDLFILENLLKIMAYSQVDKFTYAEFKSVDFAEIYASHFKFIYENEQLELYKNCDEFYLKQKLVVGGLKSDMSEKE